MQTFLPLPPRSTVKPALHAMSHTLVGPGDVRVLLTDLNDIGTFVARVIADERTLNKAVIIWEDERPMRAAREVGEEASGEADAMRAMKKSVCRALFIRGKDNADDVRWPR